MKNTGNYRQKDQEGGDRARLWNGLVNDTDYRLSTEVRETTVYVVPNLIYRSCQSFSSAPIYDRFTGGVFNACSNCS